MNHIPNIAMRSTYHRKAILPIITLLFPCGRNRGDQELTSQIAVVAAAGAIVAAARDANYGVALLDRLLVLVVDFDNKFLFFFDEAFAAAFGAKFHEGHVHGAVEAWEKGQIDWSSDTQECGMKRL
jgi:hypothetical protein